MRIHQKNERWSRQEIECIKSGFLSGLPIKILARKIGRSPSALNKALSRFRIRQGRSEDQGFVKKKRPVRTSMKLVIQFLNSYGYNVSEKSFQIGDECTREYFVNQQPIAAIRLIVIANCIRLEERRPIFLVDGYILDETEDDA